VLDARQVIQNGEEVAFPPGVIQRSAALEAMLGKSEPVQRLAFIVKRQRCPLDKKL